MFSGMNIHVPAILGFTRYQGFDTLPYHYLECFLVARSYQLQDFATNHSIDVDVAEANGVNTKRSGLSFPVSLAWIPFRLNREERMRRS